MKVLSLTSSNHQDIIQEAIHTLRNGGLVIYPTETTYGIGADCENEQAITKLISYKSKRDGKPISVAVASPEQAEKYVTLNETARNVYKTFLPGPVTVISKGTGVVANGVASQTGAVGIRIPNYPLILTLLSSYGKGITATGANASYQKRPYNVQDIFDNISDRQKEMIDLVIDAGELPHNEPSTVIDTTLDDVIVTRIGIIHFQEEKTTISSSVDETKQIAQTLASKYRSKYTYSPIIFALNGEMGAGKTQFAKGIALGLHMTETVSSPTYALESEYQFICEGRPGILLHIDTWKMESVEELKELDLLSSINKNAVIIVEWADRFTSEITDLAAKAVVVWVTLKPIDENTREVTISEIE